MSDKFIKPRVNKALFCFRDCWDFPLDVWRLLDADYGLSVESYFDDMPPVLNGKLSSVMMTLRFLTTSGGLRNIQASLNMVF